MPIVGLFGAFTAFVGAELGGNSRTRPLTRLAFFVVVLEAGGAGPSAALKFVANVIL